MSPESADGLLSDTLVQMMIPTQKCCIYIETLCRYVKKLEMTLVDTCRLFGVDAHCNKETGVWVDDRKIASIGMPLSPPSPHSPSPTLSLSHSLPLPSLLLSCSLPLLSFSLSPSLSVSPLSVCFSLSVCLSPPGTSSLP